MRLCFTAKTFKYEHFHVTSAMLPLLLNFFYIHPKFGLREQDQVSKVTKLECVSRHQKHHGSQLRLLKY